MTTDKQKRYTFESTRKNSRELREKLLILIKENSPIEQDEKSKMLNLIDRSTLGIGVDPVTFHMSDYDKFIVPDFQHFMRCLIEYDKNIVDGSFFIPILGSNHFKRSYNISELWQLILYNLNHFIPKALEASAKMSKEIISDAKDIRTIRTVKKT